MKLPMEIVALVLLPTAFLGTVQLLHVAAHSNYCKTHSEWVDTLPENIQDQIKD